MGRTAVAWWQSLADPAICFGLLLAAFAVYAQVRRFDFLVYDDDLYVYNNVHVQAGLTLDSIVWALTAVVSANWMPVTLLSHILDWQLFEAQSGMHHLVNILFHALSAVLLFVTLQRATRARWPSAFVALVFALHPLHVESVAWVSERKDVLSAFFCFLALYAYVRFAERPSLGRELLVLAPFCLGLMSKPMLVTFPFVLLLFDVWPLRRVEWPKTVWEKWPMITISALSCAVTFFVQRSEGAVNAIPLMKRMANAPISYVAYLYQTFWPARMAVFYPYPQTIPAWQAVTDLAIVLGVSGFAIIAWRTRPYLAVGWFWFLGTLVPVIGLVQVGMQAHADRYMYIPMVGLLIIVAWSAADAVRKWPRVKFTIIAAAAASAMLCAALGWKEASYWQNTETLFQHAIDVTGDNWVAQLHLAYYLTKTPGRESEASAHYDAVGRINPGFAEASNNFGAGLIRKGDCQAAIPHLEVALRVNPDLAAASNNLGVCNMVSGNYEAAIRYFEAALQAKPDYPDASFALGVALSKVPGRTLDAIAQYQSLLHMKPDHAGAHRNLAVLFDSLGRTHEAISHFEAAQHIRPDPKVAEMIERLRAKSK